MDNVQESRALLKFDINEKNRYAAKAVQTTAYPLENNDPLSAVFFHLRFSEIGGGVEGRLPKHLLVAGKNEL